MHAPSCTCQRRCAHGMFVPGIGKTQLGIQLAVDVHLPAHFNGLQVAMQSLPVRLLGSFTLYSSFL